MYLYYNEHIVATTITEFGENYANMPQLLTEHTDTFSEHRVYKYFLKNNVIPQ